MKIKKKYHFYAAHRNKDAGEKCGRIHGHTYDVVCIFDLTMNGDLTILFSDIDAKVEPIIKEYDHYFLLNQDDPLCVALDFINEPYRSMPFITSAENMAIWLFNRIKRETGLNICRIELAETKSSNVIYEQ
jgi:6-pyruvoyltetrahydropterin/6-carboxytetrahydropterin synthase